MGGILGKNKESKLDKQKRHLIDDLLASVHGTGPFSDMFKVDEKAFQKSYVEPAKQRFRDQISPQIQQQYIASGQHRGTGLEDTLSRAGVDLDQMLNQQYAQMQESAQNRQQSAINSILGGSYNPGQSTASAAGQGLAGYFSGGGFGKDIAGFTKGQVQPSKARSGFTSDNDFDYYR